MFLMAAMVTVAIGTCYAADIKLPKKENIVIKTIDTKGAVFDDEDSSLTLKGQIGLQRIEINGICPINLTEANIVDPSFHLPSSLTFIISDDLLSSQNKSVTLPISGLKDKIEQCTFLTSENEAATIKNVTDTSVTLSLN